MKVLNKVAREELGWKSPFEVCYGRKSNILVKLSHKKDKAISFMATLCTGTGQDHDFKTQEKKSLSIRDTIRC